MFIHPQEQYQEKQRKTPEEIREEDAKRIKEFSKYAIEYSHWLDKVEAESRKSCFMVKSLEAA